jgi:hypothetical protein
VTKRQFKKMRRTVARLILPLTVFFFLAWGARAETSRLLHQQMEQQNENSAPSSAAE